MIFYTLFLALGFLLGWIVRSFHMGRYFAWVLKSSIEFGGSEDEMRAYNNSLEFSLKHFPKFTRSLLWIKNRS